MIRYRPYLNCDAPKIAAIWRSQPPLRAVVPGVTPQMLEEHVFSKLYFDRHALVVAEDDGGKLIGFAHGGFAGNAAGTAISTSAAVVNLLMTMPGAEHSVATQLVTRLEQHLQARGATTICAGRLDACGPFYLGFYGGSQLPGVLAGDESWLRALGQLGYEEIERRVILQRRLSDFRPPMDRQVLQVRRKSELTVLLDPPCRTWWDVCTTGNAQRTRFRLSCPSNDQLWAEATFWNVEPIASHWSLYAVGLLDMDASTDAQQQGWDGFLLAEAIRSFKDDGIVVVEIQASQQDKEFLALLDRLGFEVIDEALVFEKAPVTNRYAIATTVWVKSRVWRLDWRKVDESQARSASTGRVALD